ncbi:MAG TPA: tetratricopeptide repeat protein [Pyrinomonadaceae bacterium]|nr:tetratricopeptide repeat protein [Pyrinomonadaceae bacterium]
MNRDNLLFTIIGLLLGFIVGFMFASSITQREAMPTPSATARTQNLPPDHPTTGGAQPGTPGQMQAEVTAALDTARKEPNNFEAQLKAAELYYQIQRYDDAIGYLLKANQLQPDSYEVVANLGMVNMDAGHYETAEKWYEAALLKKPEDVRVLDGLCVVYLEQGKAKEAEATIAKLAKAEPTNSDLSQFRDRLAKLKSGDKSK